MFECTFAPLWSVCYRLFAHHFALYYICYHALYAPSCRGVGFVYMYLVFTRRSLQMALYMSFTIAFHSIIAYIPTVNGFVCGYFLVLSPLTFMVYMFLINLWNKTFLFYICVCISLFVSGLVNFSALVRCTYKNTAPCSHWCKCSSIAWKGFAWNFEPSLG